MVLWVCKVQDLFGNCAQPGARSHLLLPLMNRHNQTKSAKRFQSLVAVFPKDLFSDYLYRKC